MTVNLFKHKLTQHYGFILVNFVYSRILIFHYFDDDNEGDRYLNWRAGLVFLCFSGFPECGNPVPKHVAGDTHHESYFMI
jgi:hypothetical protein